MVPGRGATGCQWAGPDLRLPGPFQLQVELNLKLPKVPSRWLERCPASAAAVITVPIIRGNLSWYVPA
jgi:hypothetical protein